MSHLIPCPECGRHVRNTEAACPFCALPLDLAHLPAPQLPTQRLSRAAQLAFTATLASATALAACSGTTDGGTDPAPVAGSAGMETAGTAGSPPSDGGAVAVYGAPPAGSGGTAGIGSVGGVYGAPAGAPNNGGTGGIAGDGGTAGIGSIGGVYGAPGGAPSGGAGGTGGGQSGAGPVYGAPPPQD